MNITQETKNKIDELVLYAEKDPELAEALKWLDKTEKFTDDMSFYEKVMVCLQKYDADYKAKAWRWVKEIERCKQQVLTTSGEEGKRD